MIIYLLLANIYLAVFYTFYHFLLRKETFFRLNRYYLLSGLLLSFTLPLISIPIGLPVIAQLGEAMIGQETIRLGIIAIHGHAGSPESSVVATPTNAQLSSAIKQIYIGGCAVMLLYFLVSLTRTIRVIRKRKAGPGAFSFFGIVSVSENLDRYRDLLNHERVHAREWHSLDILLVQVIRIFNWFNPFVYALERSLKLQHEYCADSLTSPENRVDYAELLLTTALDVPAGTLTHQFIHPSTLKSRIMMLFKEESPKEGRLKFILVVPVILGMAVMSSAFNTVEQEHPTVENVSLSTPVAVDIPHHPDTSERQVDAFQFQKTEIPPLFVKTEKQTIKESMTAFRLWINNNFIFPQEAIDANFSGIVEVSFVINTEGKMTDIEVRQNPGYGLKEAAIDVLEKSPDWWRPGIVNGQPVSVSFTLPIQLTSQRF